MELEGVCFEEIKPFCDSLTIEKEDFDPLRYALNAEFVVGVKRDGNLAGLGGVVRSYKYFHSCFWVVKSEFQRKGIGYEISQRIIDFARRRYSFLILSTLSKLTPAINLYIKSGFRFYYKKGDNYYMCLPLNKRGGFICKFLPLIMRAYLSPLGNIPCFLRRLSNQNKKQSA